MDKRDLHTVFRERLRELMARFDGRQAAFARSVGIDRSALSQLLTGRSTRLPRAEILHRLADAHNVSLDWLLGLSQVDRQTTQMTQTLEIEEAAPETGDTLLAKWHREAVGYKIRYIPAGLPDLLRTEPVIAHQADDGRRARTSTQMREADRRLQYTRRPETDMEVCLPLQTLSGFAAGEGIWADMDRDTRRAQLVHMAGLVEELYPTFRLFLFDGRTTFSAAYTVFGPVRAALYIGDMYMVLNAPEQVRTLTDHFDELIRRARVNPHEASGHIRALQRLV